MDKFRSYVALTLKGAAMGAANVIPGVSGGTIAFITGIYETLIHSIKSFDLQAFRLLISGQIRAFIQHTNLPFLFAVFFGIAVSILSLAKLMEYLFVNYEMLTLAFFFGLILASVFLVGKQVKKWSGIVIVIFVIGAIIAIGISFLSPGKENAGFVYVFICGIVAVCSMILPGLSGSYLLLIMGNYLLVMRAVSDFNFGILVPLLLGCIIGLVAFSHLLDYIFRHFHDETVSILTGFVFGSLAIIWPWKETLYLKDESGNLILKGGTDAIEAGYQHIFPTINGEFFTALGLILAGVLIVLFIERLGALKPQKSES